jgi:uncharacterized protein YgiM (DUF1202 family)
MRRYGSVSSDCSDYKNCISTGVEKPMRLIKLVLPATAITLCLGSTIILAVPLFAQTKTPSIHSRNQRVPDNVCMSRFRIVRTHDGKNLNVRSGMNSNDRNIGSLPNGSEVLFNLSDKSGEWAEITAPGGLTGMVPAQLLVSSPTERSKFNGFMRVKTLDGDSVNIRSNAAVGSRVLGRLASNTVVKYNGFEGYWSDVTTPNGLRGYISSQYLVCN